MTIDDQEIEESVRAMVAMDTLERIENRLDELLGLLERYQPLLDAAEGAHVAPETIRRYSCRMTKKNRRTLLLDLMTETTLSILWLRSALRSLTSRHSSPETTTTTETP